MKGYSEQRGVQSQIAFDAVNKQFVQADAVHDFIAAIQSRAVDTPNGSFIALADCEKKVAVTSASRNSRDAVMRPAKMRRTG